MFFKKWLRGRFRMTKKSIGPTYLRAYLTAISSHEDDHSMQLCY